MRTVIQGVAGILAALMLASSAMAADEANSLVDAISGGDAGLSFRYRYEFVDDERFSANANASVCVRFAP